MAMVHGAECAYKGKAKLGAVIGGESMAKKTTKKVVKKSKAMKKGY